MTIIDPTQLKPVEDRARVYLEVGLIAGAVLLLILIHAYFMSGINMPKIAPYLGGTYRSREAVSAGYTHLDDPRIEPESGARRQMYGEEKFRDREYEKREYEGSVYSR